MKSKQKVFDDTCKYIIFDEAHQGNWRPWQISKMYIIKTYSKSVYLIFFLRNWHFQCISEENVHRLLQAFYNSILILWFQVLVVSADPQMTLGVVDLIAKDTTGEDAGTVDYELIKDG